METEQFDVLTRQLGSAGPSRRQALRVLGSLFLGGALGSGAARIDLAEDAAAKPKKHRKAKATRQRTPHAERKGHGPLQAAGKKHKKHKEKHHKKPKKPQNCDEIGCTVSGGRCCPDGFCAQGDQCCSDQRTCSDGTCVAADQCCPNETTCADGSCIPETQCCPGLKTCAMHCVAQDECCPDALPPLCTECEEAVCDNGDMVCRPTPHPTCLACEEAVCDDGTWSCQFNPESCPPCPEDTVSCPGMQRLLGPAWCCPENLFFHAQGRPVCDWANPNGGPIIFCDSPTGH